MYVCYHGNHIPFMRDRMHETGRNNVSFETTITFEFGHFMRRYFLPCHVCSFCAFPCFTQHIILDCLSQPKDCIILRVSFLRDAERPERGLGCKIVS